MWTTPRLSQCTPPQFVNASHRKIYSATPPAKTTSERFAAAGLPLPNTWQRPPSGMEALIPQSPRCGSQMCWPPEGQKRGQNHSTNHNLWASHTRSEEHTSELQSL